MTTPVRALFHMSEAPRGTLALSRTFTHPNARTWPSVNEPHSNHLDNHLHREQNVEYHLVYVGKRDQHARV